MVFCQFFTGKNTSGNTTLDQPAFIQETIDLMTLVLLTTY